MKKLNGILWGVAFIAIGALFALNALDITNVNVFFDGWWSLLIIIPCAIELISGNDRIGSLAYTEDEGGVSARSQSASSYRRGSCGACHVERQR